MGKAYQPEQRVRVKELLEAGRDEESIEKETGVSDRTIRRWKLELERTGRIGKPPESRTGRHRVLTTEVENALFNHVRDKPELSVDDMLWWLYETFQIVVGTRTIRRVFERKGEAGNRFKKSRQSITNTAPQQHETEDSTEITGLASPDQTRLSDHYQAPYVPMANMTTANSTQADIQLAQALQQNVYPPPPTHQQMMGEVAEDEETLELELQAIALQKREIELKLRKKRLQQGKTPGTPITSRKPETPSSLSTLYKPSVAAEPTPPKRDSRSKKKIEESKRRTAERQERMLRDLERRSRRREHLTAEWVQSKDIWPLRAQAHLADLMHQYHYYAFSQNNVETFEAMYNALYALVDHSRGDWNHDVHDDMLRERMKRKMSQLRSKMQKTGEIIGRGDAFGSGWTKAENYTGQQVRDMDLDETDPELQAHELQAQAGALGTQAQHSENLQYEPVPDSTAHQALQHTTLPYGTAPMLHHTPASSYPLIDNHHQTLLPYAQMPPQPGIVHQDSIGL
ncbi:hypothetical protein AMS68_001728 [Peltaster fructicola]|uniref:Uncharacterized protein n=1 Tax=Peltaster fructicola TaxID=286661 RepID=A0A6H0XNI1_9PEZI|nr:hypothetical protein AMS68_001728 [Peltaster fructicola]